MNVLKKNYRRYRRKKSGNHFFFSPLLNREINKIFIEK